MLPLSEQGITIAAMTKEKNIPGNEAAVPIDIPALGWWQILKRTFHAMDEQNLSLLSAGVAFYFLVALFPLLTAFLSLYGLLGDPATLSEKLFSLGAWVPTQALELVRDQLDEVMSSRDGALGAGVVFGFIVGLWGAAKGSEALVRALNVTYREHSRKNMLVQRLIGMAVTLSMIAFMLVAVLTVAGLSFALDLIYLPAKVETVISYARWPLLWLLALTALAALYRFSPSREKPQWRWLNWGAMTATGMWLIGSLLFSLYVSNVGSYNDAYGTLGAVMVLMLWFWLTVFSILLGGQLNSELEYQTRRDTTAGKPLPLGERGAYVADHHIGDSQKERSVPMSEV